MSKVLDPFVVLESAYVLDGPEDTWLGQLLATVRDYLHGDVALSALVFRVGDADDLVPLSVALLAAPELEGPLMQVLATNRAPMLKVFRADAVVSVLSASPPEVFEAHAPGFFGPLGAFGVADSVAVCARQDWHRGLALCSFCSRPAELLPRDTERLQRLVSHIKAAHRLRGVVDGVAPPDSESAQAIFDSDCRLVHLSDSEEPSRSAVERLVHQVKTHDRVRTKSLTPDRDEALGLWTGLVDGIWSLVGHADTDGKQFVVAHRNPARHPDPRALTPRERDVVYEVSFGSMNAEIGYTLGISESAVGTHVSTALRKLGFARREDLVRFVRGQQASTVARVGGEDVAVIESSLGPDTALPGEESLTASEREVFGLLLAGADRRSIAETRQTTYATVNKQVGAVFTKLGVSSHAELLARAAGSPD
ncbi:MAG: LuxR C-terminal-related transcriptional regulator [Myxococcota bacterium]